jgi:4'-phosphopantetheinyl transferase
MKNRKEPMSQFIDVWPLPPENLALNEGELHLWRAWLDMPSSVVSSFWDTLSPDERLRVHRFHFEKDRVRFIVSHGVLRDILACYLQVEPASLQFRYGKRGKPFLSTECDGGGIQFNMAHSCDLAVYAICRHSTIGVDVEQCRQDFSTEEIAKCFFSKQEISALQTLPPGERVQGFFNCWTRKEAYIKAKGEGLCLDLSQFAVSLKPGEPAILMHTENEPSESCRWQLIAFSPGEGYTGAVAVERGEWRIFPWQWMTKPEWATRLDKQDGNND